MTRTFCIILLGIALLPSALAAEQRLVHVLGSYSEASNAEAEQIRLTEQLGSAVEVQFDTSRSVYRVIIDATLIDDGALANIDSWLMSMPSSATVSLTTTKDPKISQPAPDQPQVTVTLATPEETEQTVKAHNPQPLGPLYPAFEPGETLSAYCDRLPESRLCLHPRMQRAIEQDRKLAAHRASIANACASMNDPERRETCEGLRDESLP